MEKNCDTCEFNVGVCIGRFYGVDIDCCKEMLVNCCEDYKLAFRVYQEDRNLGK